MSDSLQPLPASQRHPADYRDEIEQAEVARILAGLPEQHPARVAYACGAREAADSIALTYLVAEHPERVDALKEAYLSASGRILARWGAHFRP